MSGNASVKYVLNYDDDVDQQYAELYNVLFPNQRVYMSSLTVQEYRNMYGLGADDRICETLYEEYKSKYMQD